MSDHVIDSISTRDARFPLPPGVGTDSVHTNPEYCLAVTLLASGDLCGTGIALTLGEGNRLVCEAIELLVKPLAGVPIEELMADFGRRSRMLADDPSLRWLGPHKGIVHLALASITNACFDLWAKTRGVPLWKLLLNLTPQQVVDLLDLSYLEDVLTKEARLPCYRQACPIAPAVSRFSPRAIQAMTHPSGGWPMTTGKWPTWLHARSTWVSARSS